MEHQYDCEGRAPKDWKKHVQMRITRSLEMDPRDDCAFSRDNVPDSVSKQIRRSSKVKKPTSQRQKNLRAALQAEYESMLLYIIPYS